MLKGDSSKVNIGRKGDVDNTGGSSSTTVGNVMY